MPSLREDRKEALVYARKDFETTWEALDRVPDHQGTLDAYRVARDKWVETRPDVRRWAAVLNPRSRPDSLESSTATGNLRTE